MTSTAASVALVVVAILLSNAAALHLVERVKTGESGGAVAEYVAGLEMTEVEESRAWSAE